MAYNRLISLTGLLMQPFPQVIKNNQSGWTNTAEKHQHHVVYPVRLLSLSSSEAILLWASAFLVISF